MGFQHEKMGLRSNLKTPKRMQGYHRGYIGIVDKKMETTILYRVIKGEHRVS